MRQTAPPSGNRGIPHLGPFFLAPPPTPSPVAITFRSPRTTLEPRPTPLPHGRRYQNVDRALQATSYPYITDRQPGRRPMGITGCFFTFKTNFGLCSLMRSKIIVHLDSAPVTFLPYRIRPILAKKADAVLDQYLGGGLIQHSTSPYSSPMVTIPRKYGGVRVPIN